MILQKNYAYLISLLVFMSACSESTFSSDSSKANKGSQNQAQTQTQASGSQNNPQGENGLPNQGNSPILSSQTGGVMHKELPDATIPPDQSMRTVQACFSYDKTKLHLHMCNLAVFDVLFFNNKVGQINLNNFPAGNSVEGGKINGQWGSDGTFTLMEKCALPICHKDVTFLSLIGEIVDSLGRKKWLKIEQGQIKPDTSYTYKFTDFALSEVEMSFGPLCTIVNK